MNDIHLGLNTGDVVASSDGTNWTTVSAASVFFRLA